MPLSNVTKGQLIDWLTGRASIPATGTRYATLTSTLGTLTGGGTEIAVTRQALTAGVPSGGLASSTVDIVFTGLPACTIVGLDFYDALTTGNYKFGRALMQSVVAEAVTLSGGIGKVANVGAVSFVVVKDSTNVTTYTENVDYTFDYDHGTISYIVGGAITVSQLLHISYYYPISVTVPAGSSYTVSAGNWQLELTGYT